MYMERQGGQGKRGKEGERENEGQGKRGREKQTGLKQEALRVVGAVRSEPRQAHRL